MINKNKQTRKSINNLEKKKQIKKYTKLQLITKIKH